MTKMTAVCLNCNEPLIGNYCTTCGQSASTHRFTLKHIFTQDFVRVIFYINKGFFYTLKELFTRPGNSVREYVSGKRVKHLNYFTLLIVVLIVFTILEQITPFHFTDLVEENNEIIKSFDLILKKYPKFLYVGIIPFYALFSFLIFKKAQQNYAEHVVLTTFRVAVIIIFNILFISFASVSKDISIIRKGDTLLAWMGTAYGTWFYCQYFHPFYQSKFMLFIKSLLVVVLPGLILILGFVTYFILNGKTLEELFGK